MVGPELRVPFVVLLLPATKENRVAAAARVFDAPIERLDSEPVQLARVSRWDAPLWPADELDASPARPSRDAAPLEILLLVASFGARPN